MSGHTEGMLINKFCTQRKGTCAPCGNSYADVVDPDDYKFPRLVQKKAGPETLDISANAHHILCVAEVTKVLSKDKKLKKVLENTKWCINTVDVNLISLPLFYHTVHWYCKDRTGEGPGGRRTKLGDILTSLKAPPFKDLPNHDFDHGEYNKEVETDLNKLSASVKQAVHKYDSVDVAGRLDTLSNNFRTRLESRGIRQGGTHVAWLAAVKGECDKWYEPFSLASGGGVTKKAFPGKVRDLEDELSDVLDSLTDALLNR